MALYEDGDRTEPATPRRRQEAREQGQVAKSQDLNTALILLAACLALHFLGLPGLRALGAEVVRGFLECGCPACDVPTVTRTVGAAAVLAAQVLLPLGALLFIAGASANLLQVGFLMTGQPVMPDLNRVNPARGFARIASSRSLFRGAFGLLKLSVVGVVLVTTLWGEVSTPAGAGRPSSSRGRWARRSRTRST